MRRAAIFFLTLVGCSDPPTAPDQCAAPVPRGVSQTAPVALWPERMFAAAIGPGAVQVGGFDGAAAPGVRLRITAEPGGRVEAVRADGDGRFSLTLDAATTVRVEAPDTSDEPVTLRVRDPAVARGRVVGAPLGAAGSVPNDLVYVGAPPADRAVLVRSGDNGVTAFSVHAGFDRCTRGFRFANDGTRPPTPWFAAPLQDGRLAVSLFGLDRVAVVRMEADEPELLLAAPAVTLDAPRTLGCAVDVDGDGAAEAQFTRFLPRAPQGLVAIPGAVVAAFSGFLRRADGRCGPLFVPGVLVRFPLDRSEPPSALVLPFDNPQEVRVLADGTLLVVASGVLELVGGQTRAATAGGLAWIDAERFTVTSSRSLGDFAAGSAIESGGRLWVASLVRPVLQTIDAVPLRVVLNAETTDSIFRLQALPGGLILAGSFNTDRLHVVDGRTGALDPPPFFGPIVVGPGRPLFDGLQIVAVRGGRRGFDFVGPDVLVLAGIASRITPLDFGEVLGP